MDASADPKVQDSKPANDLGVKLRSAREAQKLSLDKVSADLRISVEHLRALEESRFNVLGAPVFAKGYLKQYGARLGLDVQALAADYERAEGDSAFQISPSPSIRLRDERQITIWIASGLVIVVLAAGLAYWWRLQQAPDTAEEATVAGEAAAAVSVAPDSASVLPESVSTEVVQRESVPAASGSQAAAGLRPAEAETETETIEEPELVDFPGDSVGPSVVLDGAFEILFLEDSWTEISDLDGEQLFYDLGRAGETVRLPADRGLSVFFGNGAGVELRLDDAPFSIPATARRGDFAEFDLDPITD